MTANELNQLIANLNDALARGTITRQQHETEVQKLVNYYHAMQQFQQPRRTT